ncbi:MAG: sigma-54-dependent Fis family transcriptional regulator [Krumholzibacteria bacterium]|nr:sigma-54-dependent Fis family transcriptional regulator [Candidatus Krumholzibacteria bacterium]
MTPADPKPVILVIDDEEAIRLFLEATLEDRGYDVVTAATGQEALARVARAEPDLVLLDLMLPDMSGIQVLEEVKKALPHVNVLMLTAYSGTETAVRAMKLDAFDYVTKPIELDRLLRLVQRGLDASAPARERYRRRAEDTLFADRADVVPSCSPRMLELYAMVGRIADSDATTVLIEGESGVGKDVVAEQVHRSSRRAGAAFVDINCAALPEQLLESELFGHEKGAFTDAVQQKPGLLETADGGTVFLDEIGEMALPVQVKLLRVLEKRTFRRVGGVKDITVDVRLVAATNRDLRAQVRAGTFREDLYYRLQVVQLRVPPLRARTEDILPLAEHFLARFGAQFGREFREIAPDAVRALTAYPWPGNIRELRNALERAVLLEEGPVLRAAHLHLGEAAAGPGAELARDLSRVLEGGLTDAGCDLEGLVGGLERHLVGEALFLAGGNQSRAARLLGLNRDKFRYRLRQFGLGEEQP